jgi:hypothetical protein
MLRAAGAKGYRLISDPQRAIALQHEQRFFVSAMKVVRKSELQRRYSYHEPPIPRVQVEKPTRFIEAPILLPDRYFWLLRRLCLRPENIASH